MEKSSSRGYTFLVGLKPAHQLLRCLNVMTGLSSSVVLIVKGGKIQIVSSSDNGDAHASVEMKAFTSASWGLDWFAIKFDPSLWVQLINPSVAHQETESLWIYKIGVFPNLCCLVGHDSVPIRLGETQFVRAEGTDMKYSYLERLASNPVKVEMRSKCLREVISAFAPSYRHVGLLVMRDRVTWHTLAGELSYDVQNGDCLTRGVEEGTACCLQIEWRGAGVLHFALSHSESEGLCTCCSLVHRDWMGWIRFSFAFDGVLPFFYLMRGSSHQLHL